MQCSAMQCNAVQFRLYHELHAQMDKRGLSGHGAAAVTIAGEPTNRSHSSFDLQTQREMVMIYI